MIFDICLFFFLRKFKSFKVEWQISWVEVKVLYFFLKVICCYFRWKSIEKIYGGVGLDSGCYIQVQFCNRKIWVDFFFFELIVFLFLKGKWIFEFQVYYQRLD